MLGFRVALEKLEVNGASTWDQSCEDAESIDLEHVRAWDAVGSAREEVGKLLYRGQAFQ